jgi:8-oxo-dGTP diphosphatase
MPENSCLRKSPLLVSAAIIIEDSRVLLTRRPEHKPMGGFWEFPGGKLNPGESPAAALKRELEEELAAQVQVDAIFEVVFHSYTWGDVLIMVFTCTRLNQRLENLEVAEHCWVPLTQLHHYQLLPADIPLIARLQASL